MDNTFRYTNQTEVFSLIVVGRVQGLLEESTGSGKSENFHAFLQKLKKFIYYLARLEF